MTDTRGEDSQYAEPLATASENLQGITTKDGKMFFDSKKLCAECHDHYWKNPYISEACASVGIEHGKSTGLMLAEYFTTFHKNKHKEPK